MKILQLLQKCLAEITGMDTGTLEPAAGAQGELTGLLLIRAYLEDTEGHPRKKFYSGLRAWHQSGDRR